MQPGTGPAGRCIGVRHLAPSNVPSRPANGNGNEVRSRASSNANAVGAAQDGTRTATAQSQPSASARYLALTGRAWLPERRPQSTLPIGGPALRERRTEGVCTPDVLRDTSFHRPRRPSRVARDPESPPFELDDPSLELRLACDILGHLDVRDVHSVRA